MHVQIDESGRDDQAARVERFVRAAGYLADLRDLATADQDVGRGIEILGRIDDPPATNQERTSFTARSDW